MFSNLNQNYIKETILYNNIVLLARNKSFYTKFSLSDTFQNRIHLIFLHASFLFIKIKLNKTNKSYKTFYQKNISENPKVKISFVSFARASKSRHAYFICCFFVENCYDKERKHSNYTGFFSWQNWFSMIWQSTQ